MMPLRRDFGQWFEHEYPFGEARVRQHQIRFGRHRVANQQQIQIERARRVRVGALPSSLAFDCEQLREKLTRRGTAGAGSYGVQVWRLSAGNTDRVGLADRGEPKAGEQPLKPGPGVVDMRLPIAEVRSDADRDYSIHRDDITDPTRGPT